jgi:hypothetical protein
MSGSSDTSLGEDAPPPPPVEKTRSPSLSDVSVSDLRDSDFDFN